MTSISISLEDFQRLSLRTRQEITALLIGEDGFEAQSFMKNFFDEYGQPIDFTEAQAKQLIEGIAETTARYLRAFVDGNGKASLEDLLKATGYDTHRDLTGVSSGLTKRVRKIAGSPRAYLVERQWKPSVPLEYRKADTAEYFISEQTLRSLEAVLPPIAG